MYTWFMGWWIKGYEMLSRDPVTNTTTLRWGGEKIPFRKDPTRVPNKGKITFSMFGRKTSDNNKLYDKIVVEGEHEDGRKEVLIFVK